MGEGRASGVYQGRGPRDHRFEDAEGGRFQTGIQAQRDEIHRCGAHLAYGPTLAWASSNTNISWRRRAGAMGGGTEASWRWRRMRVMTDSWVKVARLPPPTQWRKNGSNDAQGATPAKRTGGHIQIKNAAEQPGPVPVRGSCLRFFAVHTLLAWGGNDRGPQLAVRRQTATVAHQVGTRQGY